MPTFGRTALTLPTNLVTTDSAQTITAQKVFAPTTDTAPIIIRRGTDSSPVASLFTVTNAAGNATFVNFDQNGNASFPVVSALNMSAAVATFAPLGDMVGLTLRRGTDTAPTANIAEWRTGANALLGGLDTLGRVFLPETAAPSTPASGYGTHWIFSTDSRPYFTSDTGAVASLTAIENLTFAVTGTVAVTTGKSRIYLEGNYVFETARASVNTAPTGATLIVDINKNGTTIFTTQSARPTIAISGFTASGNSPAITTFASGDYITVDVDQVGSTIAGADLTVNLRLRKVA